MREEKMRQGFRGFYPARSTILTDRFLEEYGDSETTNKQIELLNVFGAVSRGWEREVLWL